MENEFEQYNAIIKHVTNERYEVFLADCRRLSFCLFYMEWVAVMPVDVYKDILLGAYFYQVAQRA